MGNRIPCRALLLGLLVLVAPAAAGKEIRAGRRFLVVAHFEAGETADAALRTAEAAGIAAGRLLAAAAPAPERRATIHLYRTPADYRRAESSITGGRFADANAFSSHARQDAHIAVEPEQDDTVLRTIGLSAQTRRMIAHEAAHLLLYAACPSHRDHPRWLAEGFATWVADEVLATSSVPLADQPFASTRMVRLRRLLEEKALPTVEQILGGELPGLTLDERYAVWRQMFRVLASGRARPGLRRFLAEATRLRPGPDLTSRLAKTLATTVGPAGRIDARFRDSVRALRPAWEQVYRMLDVRADRWIQLAFHDTNAIAWRTRAEDREGFLLTGTLEILTPRSPQMNVLLGRTERGFVSVAFRAGDGITVLRYHAATDRWQRLGRSTSAKPTLGRRHAFRIRTGVDAIEIRLDDAEAFRVPTGFLDGPWGLGVQAGGAGVWREVRVERR